MAFDKQNTGYRKFTEDEIAEARKTELADAAGALGYHPRRVGKYYDLEEHDSFRIFPNNTYCRFANVIDGKPETGSVIDFVMRYGGMDFREAVAWLLDFSGRSYGRERIDNDAVSTSGVTAAFTETTEVQNGKRTESRETENKGNKENELTENRINSPQDSQTERPEFQLPEPNDNNRRMYAYLCKTRGIPSNIVHEMWKKGLIYESRLHHNVVFVSRDRNGEAKHAFMRGTSGMFKCDVPGSDKLRYCFVIPAWGARTDTVCVYEGAIDAISAKALDVLDRKNGAGEPWRIALGMLSDSPLEHFLSEHPEIRKIRFCMDRDTRGRDAVLGVTGENGETVRGGLLEKWKTAGYQVTDCPPRIEKEQGKDYNDLLLLRIKTQKGRADGQGWKRAEVSPFTAERDRMLQQGLSAAGENRYGQVLASGEGRDKTTHRKKKQAGGAGKSGELQRYCNRPSASYGYGQKRQRHRR